MGGEHEVGRRIGKGGVTMSPKRIMQNNQYSKIKDKNKSMGCVERIKR